MGKQRCEELHLQPRGTRGESGGQTGHTYDISNKHRLGYSEVELVQKMIDGVNNCGRKTRNSSKESGSSELINILPCSGEGMSEAGSVTNTMNGDSLVSTAVTGHSNSGSSLSYMDKHVNYL